MMQKHSKLLFRILLPLACLGTGCGDVLTKLEFDRMSGTAFPTAQEAPGSTEGVQSLVQIFLETGLIFTVEEDQTNIAPLTGPADPFDPNQYDYITPAEMDNLMSANRSIPTDPTTTTCGGGIFPEGECTTYYVYGIVADHWYERSNGTRSTTTLGLMWDTSERAGFAIFYKNSIISSDPVKYLRTTAHEIGHAFNLHHPDGTSSTTVMNQTGVINDFFTYEFSAGSQTHLSDHPVNCARPGTGPWASIHSSHTASHGNVTCTGD